MKLQSFNIKNFRSIKDCGWHAFSTDNVTGLVGQNESGKTSLLEGLYAFSTGKIDSNDLRDKDEKPVVSCAFCFDESLSSKIEETVVVPAALKTLLLEKGCINLKRVWTDEKTSNFYFEQQDVCDYLNNQPKPEPKKTAAAEKPKTEEDIVEEVDEGQDVESLPVETVEVQEIDIELVQHVDPKALLDALLAELPAFELFTDFLSLLPDSIDLEDIVNENKKVEGLRGAMNLLKIANLDIDFLQSGNDRLIETEIDKLNKEVATDFQNFWSQRIGNNDKITIEFSLKHHKHGEPKPGIPYLSFWINDGQSKLYPKQRSKGVRWFTSFYLELKANSSTKDESQRDKVILIDEPGGSLHAKAQNDVLKVMNQISDSYQVVYTTHSPYLITADRLYRLLAVQRSNVEDEKSNTIVFSAHSLGAAHQDTLSPIYTAMGVDFSSQTSITQKNNVIVEEISAVYYLRAFAKLVGKTMEVSYLPATGATNVPMLANLFIGWGLGFTVLVDDDSQGRNVYNLLKKNLFFDNETETNKFLIKVAGHGIEDVFTKTDFKKYVIEDTAAEVGDSNAQFLVEQRTSKGMLAAKFLQAVESESFSSADLNETTVTAMTAILDKLIESIANQ